MTEQGLPTELPHSGMTLPSSDLPEAVSESVLQASPTSTLSLGMENSPTAALDDTLAVISADGMAENSVGVFPTKAIETADLPLLPTLERIVDSRRIHLSRESLCFPSESSVPEESLQELFREPPNDEADWEDLDLDPTDHLPRLRTRFSRSTSPANHDYWTPSPKRPTATALPPADPFLQWLAEYGTDSDSDRRARADRTAPRIPADDSQPDLLDAPDHPESDHIPVCRICLEDQLDDPSLPLRDRELIDPCACRGSAQWVHRYCINRWRDTLRDPEKSAQCSVCHAGFIICRPWLASVIQRPGLLKSLATVGILLTMSLLGLFTQGFLVGVDTVADRDRDWAPPPQLEARLTLARTAATLAAVNATRPAQGSALPIWGANPLAAVQNWWADVAAQMAELLPELERAAAREAGYLTNNPPPAGKTVELEGGRTLEFEADLLDTYAELGWDEPVRTRGPQRLGGASSPQWSTLFAQAPPARPLWEWSFLPPWIIVHRDNLVLSIEEQAKTGALDTPTREPPADPSPLPSPIAPDVPPVPPVPLSAPHLTRPTSPVPLPSWWSTPWNTCFHRRNQCQFWGPSTRLNLYLSLSVPVNWLAAGTTSPKTTSDPPPINRWRDYLLLEPNLAANSEEGWFWFTPALKNLHMGFLMLGALTNIDVVRRGIMQFHRAEGAPLPRLLGVLVGIMCVFWGTYIYVAFRISDWQEDARMGCLVERMLGLRAPPNAFLWAVNFGLWCIRWITMMPAVTQIVYRQIYQGIVRRCYSAGLIMARTGNGGGDTIREPGSSY